MSLEKVNKYKKDKKNRRQILEREKKKNARARIAGWIIGIAITAGLVAVLGLTAKNAYTNYQASKPNYTADSMVVNDMTGILNELDAEETEAPSGEEAGSGETEASAEEASTSAAAESSAE